MQEAAGTEGQGPASLLQSAPAQSRQRPLFTEEPLLRAAKQRAAWKPFQPPRRLATTRAASSCGTTTPRAVATWQLPGTETKGLGRAGDTLGRATNTSSNLWTESNLQGRVLCVCVLGGGGGCHLLPSAVRRTVSCIFNMDFFVW
jgi:hypothetical protein